MPALTRVGAWAVGITVIAACKPDLEMSAQRDAWEIVAQLDEVPDSVLIDADPSACGVTLP
jgi:hypothetical protein